MTAKICSRCRQIKDASEFYKNRRNKDGLQYICKDCYKQYYKDNKDKFKKYRKNYVKKRDYKVTKEQARKYYINNRSYYLNYNEKVKDKMKIYRDKYRKENYDRLREQDKIRRSSNKSRLNTRTQAAFYNILCGYTSRSKYLDYNMYTLQELKQHLESQFTPEMNWSNYGKYWVLGHVIPLSYFEFESVYDKNYRICWSLLNLAPMSTSYKKHKLHDCSDINPKIINRILGQKL